MADRFSAEQLDTLLHDIRQVLHSHPDRHAVGAALTDLRRLERDGTQTLHEARCYRDILSEFNRLKAEQHELYQRHQAELAALHEKIAEHKLENTKIREQHKHVAGDASAIIRSLKTAMDGHAQQLLELSRRKA